MLIGQAEAALASRGRNVLPNGTVYWKSTFIRLDEGEQRPNAFLVEQAGGSEIEAHFHRSNQFQVFVRGRGRLGRHPLGPVTVHYTSAFSPYGPILSEEEPLHYYTLRDDHDPGARFLPGAVAELQKAERRYATSRPEPAPDLAAVRAVTRSVAIPPEADGLGAVRIDAPPGAEIEPSLGLFAHDRYGLVLAGEIACAGDALGAGACLFLPRDETPPLRAGPDGASLMLMQFPAAGPWKPGGVPG